VFNLQTNPAPDGQSQAVPRGVGGHKGRAHDLREGEKTGDKEFPPEDKEKGDNPNNQVTNRRKKVSEAPTRTLPADTLWKSSQVLGRNKMEDTKKHDRHVGTPNPRTKISGKEKHKQKTARFRETNGGGF